MERYPFDYEKLAQYLDDEGYKSYSCHYKDVFTEMSIQKQHRDGKILSENCFDLKQVTANLKQELVSAYSVVNDFYDKNRKFKIAVLNSEGENIQTSEVIEMEVPDRGQIASAIRYDIAKNECDYERTDDPRGNNANDIRVYLPLLVLESLFIVIVLRVLLGIVVYKCTKRKVHTEPAQNSEKK